MRANRPQSIFDKQAADMPSHFFHASNSLSLKILPATPLDPRFWQDRLLLGRLNSNESRILENSEEKNLRDIFGPVLAQRRFAPSVVYL